MSEIEKNIVLGKLKKAAEAYYNNEQSELTDEEYDKLSAYAEEQGWLIQDSLVNDGAKIKSATINHKIPMLSLAKAKTVEELVSFLKRIDRETNRENLFKIEPKLDGLAITLKYTNSKLVGAYTRGTGTQGEDASHIIDNKDLEVSGIVEVIKLADCEISEVRGELVCSKENLIYNNKNRGEDFKNERIAAAGLLKKSQLGLGYKAKLDFVAYSAYDIKGNEVQIPEDFFKTSLGIRLFTIDDDIEAVLDIADTKRTYYTFPTDGIVIKMNTPVDLGATGHHPLNVIAYKYPGESKTTKLIDVKWGTGKTGRLTPVGILDPVDLGGVTVSNVSLNNIDWINERSIKIGSIVEVTRANDVIPYIKRVILNDELTKEISQPTHCPYCNTQLTRNGAYLECQNHNCPATVKNRIKQYVSKGCLDIEGMNEALIDVLILNNIKDVLDLKLETLENTQYSNGTKFGKIRALEVYNNIEKAKKNTKEYTWLTTLEIPNLGKQTAKVLLSYFGSIEKVLTATKNELISVDGVGIQMADSIIKYKDNALNIWNSIKSSIEIKESNSNNGITFCITGTPPAPYKNRNEFVKAMEEKGYVFHSSVKKDTQYLVTEDPEGNSSKLKKARELGVKLVKSLEDI